MGLVIGMGLLVLREASGLDTLHLGLISTESTAQLREAWVPILSALEDELGIPVKAHYATDYAGIIEAMRFNKVQIAWYGNKAAMEAVDRAGGEVFLRQVDSTGDRGYYSILVAHVDSGLGDEEDMFREAKGLVFGVGDPNSTSGFLVPHCYLFAPRGLEPRRIFRAVRVSNHEGNLMSVAAGQVDVATNNTENLERFRRAFPDRHERIKVIWRSPLIPSDPMVWRKDLADDIKEKVKRFFLRYGREGEAAEEERQLLERFLLSGFEESDDRQLLPVRRLELVRERLMVEGDERLGEAERGARLAEIDIALASVEEQEAAWLVEIERGEKVE